MSGRLGSHGLDVLEARGRILVTQVLYDSGSAATPRGAWKVPGPCSVSCLPLGPGGARVLLCELPQNGGLDGLTYGSGFGEWAGTILR